jgi:hypothetical protein
VGLQWIMHVEADLLDGVGEVGVGECQVLEGSSEAPEVPRISNRRDPDSVETLACVSTRVKTGLQSTMPAPSRISRANCH